MGLVATVWQGQDVNTYARITVLDSPLSVVVGAGIAEAYVLKAEHIRGMAIATSMTFGTACYIIAANGIAIEATDPVALQRGDYVHALTAAKEDVERTAEFERAWNEESDRSDELLYRIFRDSFRG